MSWRDTKRAILVFNRNQSFSDVLSTVETATPKHPKYKRTEGKSDETIFHYVFQQSEDAIREFQLAIMVFNVLTKIKATKQ